MNQDFSDVTQASSRFNFMAQAYMRRLGAVVLWLWNAGSCRCGDQKVVFTFISPQLTGDPGRKDGGLWGFQQNVQNNPDG